MQLVKDLGITEIATGTDTINVAIDSADYGATIRCICIAILTEEVMEDYSYNTIQDYSGNDIQIIGSNVVKLIGESEIYKPYAISSQFQVLSDQISSKVSQTDFNSLSGTVTEQGTLIQQNAQAILLKADTSVVNTQMNGKMGTDMSNRSSSILIDSGQIRFDSNSLVVNSSKFTLDANGNATFAGNITGASLNIGGEFVGIGDAISDAESGAISAAAIDATNKANNAKDSAINTASADATTKANNAKTSAISTAAADATTKANNAQSTAISTANAYTDNGLAGKVGNNEIRTKFAADTHSVTIESGTVKFKSNTLLIDSTQFTLDASGNATFKGNLSAATLVIGGQSTNIGTAINNAENDAIITAAADATTKANNAKTSAISTAAADATTKANNAQSNAVSIAATDATNKANQAIATAASDATYKMTSAISQASDDATAKANGALSSAEAYTDTGLATKVGNNEIRTKFAADATSVTIESGEIAFRSNTFSVDATNLEITKYGFVTAKLFKAKNMLRVIDDANTVLATMEAATNGGMVSVGKSDGTQVGTFFATSSGSDLSLGNSSGTQTIRLNGGTGNAIFGGTAKANLVSTGQVNILRSETNVASLYSTANGGVLSLKDASGNQVIQASGGLGYIHLDNPSGDRRVSLFTPDDNGKIYLYDCNDNLVIKLETDSGIVTCVRVKQTSSRKVKENIKPIEDSEKILDLQAVSFDYKNKAMGTNMRGFIAEDVAEVLPNLVTPETEETTASLDYIGMIPYLQDIIKKQEQRIQALEEKIDKLMEKEK